MPQGLLLHIPFPTRISPDYERALAQHLAWPRSFGLLPTEQAVQRHWRSRFCELAARFHPSATGADLDLAVDQESWYFVFDDQFDGPLGRDPAQTRQLVDTVADILRVPPSSPPQDAPPIVAAFADLWTRSCAGMSTTWQARAAGHWRAYLAGHVTEVAHRGRKVAPTFTDQLALRHNTIGVHPVLDMAERVGHYEVPAGAYHSQLMETMHHIVIEVVILDNELVSVEREEAAGDHNLVLAFEHEHNCTRDEAIDALRTMIHERIEHLLQLETQLPALCETLKLDAAQQTAIERYQMDALHSLMRGANEWGQRSGRYASPATTLESA